MPTLRWENCRIGLSDPNQKAWVQGLRGAGSRETWVLPLTLSYDPSQVMSSPLGLGIFSSVKQEVGSNNVQVSFLLSQGDGEGMGRASRVQEQTGRSTDQGQGRAGGGDALNVWPVEFQQPEDTQVEMTGRQPEV